MRAAILSALAALTIGGCTPVEPPQSGSDQPSGDMTPAARVACTSAGGRVERRGRVGAELCVKPFADAGKACTDTSQCQGKCVGTVEQTAMVGSVAGQCQADDALFGCYSEIRNGKAVNAICVD
jgi:hypothetical protein